MTETSEGDHVDGQPPRDQIAAAFETDRDPLAEYVATFQQLDIDPFAVARSELLDAERLSKSTVNSYRRVVEQWRLHMTEQGRHPACPDERHVRAFVAHCREDRANSSRTIKEKVRKLERLFRFFQTAPSFPHTEAFNPFTVVKQTLAAPSQSREYPRIPLPELRKRVQFLEHVRDRALVAIQLKLGLRATEVCNLRLEEVSIQREPLVGNFSSLGTHLQLDSRPNALYVPADRPGNKSRRPRVLPLDEELQQLLTDYLAVRPDNGKPWLFLSKNRHAQLRKKDVNRPWKDAFHPEYARTDEHAPVTSHYGRHRFTTYWRVNQDMSEELVKYMRGDTPGSAELEGQRAIRNYLHAYYEDIETVYRHSAFTLTPTAGAPTVNRS